MNDASEAPLLPSDLDPAKFRKTMIVYVIIGMTVITGWQLYRWRDHLKKRERAAVLDVERREAIRQIGVAEASFREREGRAARYLRDLVAAGDLEKIPFDPWTNEPYPTTIENGRLIAISLGADRAEGGTNEFDEDIRSDASDSENGEDGGS